MGVPEEHIKAQQPERQHIEELANFEIFEENVEAFEQFISLETQRRYLAGATDMLVLGLDYTAVLSYLNTLYSRKKVKRLFKELQAIEKGFVRATNDKKDSVRTQGDI